jgi:hypothetical protein
VIRDPVSWKIVKDNARRHGVAPLVASIARSHVPAAERVWCDRVLVASMDRHRRSLQDLEYLLGVFDDAGIRTLALKGPLLACRHYEPPYLRKPSVDLDLAVKEGDLDRACEALSRVGYITEPGMRGMRKSNHHVALEHPSRCRLELHFRLSHRALGIPVDEFFDRAVRCGRAWVLSPADEILHLVLHHASGRFATLFHLYEVRRIWAAAPLEVRREAVQRAVEHHFAGVFAMTDIAFRSRWGEPMLGPEIPLKRTWLQWRLTGRLFAAFERYSDPGRELPLTVRLKRKWLDFQVTDAPRDALRFGASAARIAWFQVWRRGWRTVRVYQR